MVTLSILSLWIVLTSLSAIILNRIGIPKISTYLLAGILLSPEILGRKFNIIFGMESDLLAQTLFAIIAFLVGAELDLKSIKKYKEVMIFGTIAQLLGAVICTTAAIYIFAPPSVNSLRFALLIGAIAATTAPAATLAVIEETKSKGPLTSILLGIVILDDILGVGIFSIIITILQKNPQHGHIYHAALELFAAIGFGIIAGAILGLFYHKIKKTDIRFPLFLSLILLCHFTSMHFLKSSTLSCMTFGVFLKLFTKEGPKQVIRPIHNLEEFIFMIFFILAGTQFNSSVLIKTFPLIAVYVIARSFGKYLGALAGTGVNGLSLKIRGLIGLGLLPQAGVAIGLVLSLKQYEEFAFCTPQILNIIMGSTIIYEIVGPFFTKYSLNKSGEANM